MIGEAIGGALKIGGAIFGGISASKAMKKYKKSLEAQQRQNEDWYNRRYNEDATQRADAQRMLTLLGDNVRSSNRHAAGAQAVMGGTEESLAATKAANAQTMADAAAQIAVAGERRKDSIEQTYQQRGAHLQSQLDNLEVNRANAISQAVQGVGSAAGDLAGLIPDRAPKTADAKAMEDAG